MQHTTPLNLSNHKLELVCPAGSLPALRAAVDHGADAIYIGFRDATNARNFPGLNFSFEEAQTGINYAHQRKVKVMLALNTFPQPADWSLWTSAIDKAVKLGVDAVILADPGLMQYATHNYPELRLHLSVQGSATNKHAIGFYQENFNVQRVVLPRVLSLTQVQNVINNSAIEVEVFGFGSLCVMVEGRCVLSSYITGESPNSCGVCSPAKAVKWVETTHGRESRLNNVLIDKYSADENAGYPTLCKGRFQVDGNIFYAIEEPTSLNTLPILSEIIKMGVTAIKVEGRQRSPTYVAQVTQILRAAIDSYYSNPENFIVNEEWIEGLDHVSEGNTHTLGAYHRPWQ